MQTPEVPAPAGAVCQPGKRPGASGRGVAQPQRACQRTKGRETHTAQYPLAPSTSQEPSLVVSLNSHEKLGGAHLFTHRKLRLRGEVSSPWFWSEDCRTCPRMPTSSELISPSNITRHDAQRQEETKVPSLGPNQWEPRTWEPRTRPSSLCTWKGSQEPTTWHRPWHGTAHSRHAALGSPLAAARPVLKGRARLEAVQCLTVLSPTAPGARTSFRVPGSGGSPPCGSLCGPPESS